MAIAARLTAMASVSAHCHQNASIGRYRAPNGALAPAAIAAIEDDPRICRLLPPMRRHHELRTHYFLEC
jgi:hypothetical protein